MNVRKIIDDLTRQRRGLGKNRKTAKMYLAIAIDALRTVAREMPTAARHCSFCRAEGHDGRKCPKKPVAAPAGANGAAKGSLWTTPIGSAPVPEIKVDPTVTADDVRAAVEAQAPRAAAFNRGPRHCRFCGSADHDARRCPLPYCGGVSPSACVVVGCRVHANGAKAPAGPPEVPPAEKPAADEDDEPEPAFVYPKSETLKVQQRALKTERRLPVVADRPRIVDGECTNQVRPCVFAGCKHNLAIWNVSAESGTITYTHPGKTIDELPASCVLDVVDAHPDGATLEEIGAVVGLTRERVRQIEVMAADRGKDTMPAHAA